ncbi:hypothetical protein J7T55_013880 [Diaporthe amygdali]|uniref:uncharacterized protein n=1 Tax=Phomopsis amygdali TaxID=1214568 RepID=UPI0022FE41AC|nr:uncharacterized protein J7T55_013880 [Diaporthe amygdali]KAJ0119677.1 hypothetical protein J7T55_013880 [Diaporthe amygdali]
MQAVQRYLRCKSGKCTVSGALRPAERSGGPPGGTWVWVPGSAYLGLPCGATTITTTKISTTTATPSPPPSEHESETAVSDLQTRAHSSHTSISISIAPATSTSTSNQHQNQTQTQTHQLLHQQQQQQARLALFPSRWLARPSRPHRWLKEDPWSTLNPSPSPYRLNRPLRPSTRARFRCDETRRQPGQVHSIVLLLNRTLSYRFNQTALLCSAPSCLAALLVPVRVRAGWLTFDLDLDLDLDTSDRHVRFPL